MTTWIWSKADHRGLARFVNEEAAWEAAAFDLGINRLDEEAKKDGRRTIVERIYNGLRCRQPRIEYDREPFLRHSDYRQKVRTPQAVLNTDHRGTCLDLSLLFCALCLKNDLLPFMLIIEGHALAGVVLTHGRKSQGDDTWDAFGRAGFALVKAGEGEVAAHEDVLGWIERGVLLPVECTGFAHSEGLPETCPEGRGRIAGFLDFEQAVAAGWAQVEMEARPFCYAIDIQFLQDELGFKADAPPGWSPAVRTVAQQPCIPAEYLGWLTVRMFAYGDFHAKVARDRLAEEVIRHWQANICHRRDDPQDDLHLILTAIFRHENGQSFFESVLPGHVQDNTRLRHLIDFGRDLAALVELRPLLAQVDLDRRQLRRCYLASLQDPQRAVRDLGSLGDALHDLLDLLPTRRTPWRPICEFVERIARLCRSNPLKAWVEKYEADPLSRSALREALDREEAEAVDYIVLDVPSQKPDAIEYWQHFDHQSLPQVHDFWPCPATTTSLRDAISSLADAADWSVKTRLEMFLPMDMLASDLDQWPCATFEGTFPLGEWRALAIRWRERAREGKRRAFWEEFADRLENRGYQRPLLGWVEASRPAGHDLAEKVRHGELGDCLAFQFPPFAGNPQAPHGLLRAALGEGGMAYGIWLRREPADWSTFRRDVEEVLSAGDLEAMPERIMEARRKSAGTPDPENPFRNLTLFWDDPRRNPWRQGQLTQPGH